MKLLLKNNVIAGTATDEYTGPMEYITAPADFDPELMGVYVVIDGVLTIPVPEVISMRQCRLQLLATPLGDSTGYAAVNNSIATMGEAAQIDWEYAADVQRTFPLVVAMQQMFGWSDAQMDDFFAEAAKL